MGIPTSPGLSSSMVDDLRTWLQGKSPAARAWPDHTEVLLSLCLDKVGQNRVL